MSEIHYSNDAREKLLSGIEKISKAVKVTLGPSGRNVMIKQKDQKPFSTKDGVTVAGSVHSYDAVEMMAIESLQDVARNADMKAGDGTTTATVLAESIFKQGLASGAENLIDLKRGIDIAVEGVVKLIRNKAVDVKDNDKLLRQAALVSSNYDVEAADIVLEAYKKCGNQGVVNIFRSKSHDTYFNVIEGMTLPMGFMSRLYVNDMESGECRYENARVFITSKKITEFTPNFDALITAANEEGFPFVIICKDIDPLLHEMIMRNHRSKAFRACVVKAPLFGEEQEKLLSDLALSLGGTAFHEQDGIQFDDIDTDRIFEHIPTVTELAIGEQNSAFRAPDVSEERKAEIDKDRLAFADSLRALLPNTKTQYEKSFIQSRISRLTDGIGFIHIGAYSDTEFKEKQARVQDALYAIKAAASDGIIPGGGTALLSLAYEDFQYSKNPDIAKGQGIIIQAIQEPFNQIIKNIGVVLPVRDLEDCMMNFNTGYDGKTERVVDMMEAGIVDPAKITIVALENAASIAGMMLTTECILVEEDSYKKADPYAIG